MGHFGAFTLMIIPLSFQYVIVDGLTALGMTRTSLESVSVPEISVLWGDLYPGPFSFTAQSAFLCGACGGWDCCRRFLYRVLVYLQEISGAAEED